MFSIERLMIQNGCDWKQNTRMVQKLISGKNNVQIEFLTPIGLLRAASQK
jgi:hypothetical protein